jgi:hypothetical protein
MREYKTKMLQIRISEPLDRAIKAEADQLCLKPSEVARVALARGLLLVGQPAQKHVPAQVEQPFRLQGGGRD